MTNVNVTEEARRLAGVSDPTWSPPPAPEDLTDLKQTALVIELDWETQNRDRSRSGPFGAIRVENRLSTCVQSAICSCS